jgi:copper resistance protein D
MGFWYLVAVYVHVITMAVWLGAMLFDDPTSHRFLSRIVARLRGIGWVALSVLVVTGIFMLQARGVTMADVVSGRFFTERYGQVFAAKFAFVAVLAGLQIVNGNRPGRAIYGFLASLLVVIALSVWIARPLI